MPLDNVAVKTSKKDAKAVRDDYVKKMRDNYLLILSALMHDLIVSIDQDGNFVFVNDAAVEFWDKPNKKIIGTHFAEYLHPDDLKKAIAALQDLIENKNQVRGFIVRMKSPTGFRRVAWNAIAIFNDDGDYLGVQATGKDLTTLLRAEEELEQSKQHFQRLFEVIVDPIVIVDLNGNILDLSQSAEEIMGFPREELVGKHFLETDIATAKSKAIMKKNLAKIRKGLYIRPHPIEAVSKAGKKLLYELTPAKIRYKGEASVIAIFHNITEQKKAEEKLQESEERFRYFIENAPEAIWVQDLTGTFLDGNKRAEELTGYKREELIGKNMLELNFVPSDSIPRLMEAFRANEPGEISGPTELELIRKDGTLVSIEATTIPVERDGKIEIIGITRDITARKAAQEALRESEKQFRELSELLPETVFETDVTGKLTFVNDIAFDRFGYAREDLNKGLNAFQMLVPEDRNRAKTDFETVADGTDIGFVEYTALRKDGSTFPIMIHSTPVSHADATVGLRGIIVDITERKALEKSLQESEERFSQVAENASEWIWDVDAEGLYTYSSPTVEKLLGYKAKELVGKKRFYDLFHPDDQENLKKVALSAFKQKQSFQEFVNRNVHKNGDIVWLSTSGVPLLDDKGKLVGYRGADVDITERKKMEDKLSDQNRFLNKVLDTITYPFYVIDANDYTIKLANSAAAVFGGIAENTTCYALTHNRSKPCTKPEHSCTLEEIKKTKKPIVLEHIHYDKSGNPRTFEVRGYPLFDKAGNVVQIIESSVDITERKRAEELLKESEERFRSTLDNMMEGCQLIDYDWRYIYVNDAAAKHGRFAKKDFIGKTMMDLYPYIDTTTLFSVLSKCMKERVSARTENEFTYPNGKTAWFELSIEPVPEGLFILSVDISDRKEVAEALRQEREMLETVTANINAGLTVISKNYQILWANNVLKGWVGQVEGATCYAAINQRKSVCPKCGVKEIFETGKDLVICEQEVIDQRDSKHHWMELTAAAIRDEKGEIVAASEMALDITERKNTEIQLKESLQKFRTIFEGATDGILAVDPVTRNFIFANPRMHEMLGYSFGELTNLNFADIVPKDDLAFAFGQFKKHLDEKVRLTRNVALQRKDNTVIYCDISSRLMKIGTEQYLVGFIRDVTEQKKAEEALRASEENYRELINGMNDTAWVIGFDSKFIDVNDAAVRVLGYSKEELLSMGPTDIDDSLTEQQIKGLIEGMKADEMQAFETSHITKDGKRIPVEINSTVVTYAGKNAILSIARDITERKKAEEALRKSEEKYRELINAMNDTALVMTLDGKLVDANDAAVRVLGYSKEELLSMGPTDIALDVTEEKVKGLIKLVLKNKLQVFETTHITRAGKKIPVELSSSLVSYQGKDAILSIARDITERKKAEEVVDEAMRLLKQSNTELESYTYVVSHDLKAPLRTVKSFGSFLLEDYGDKLDETGRDYLNRMVSASSRMDTMIEDLLILSRVGRKFTEFEKVDLNKLLTEILADLEATIKETKTKVVVDKLPSLLAQRVWMRQLFMNLISNALKFNESKNPKIEVLYQETKTAHLFKVVDNGIGIEEKYLTRIFNLFERAPTEKKYEGTGAGLSICKKIVEHLGGKIWVESTPRKGSVFSFTIPKK
ncbi:MAG: PAS domain S-box protein [Candidatus Bathyarchaeota archaeon]|nr:PAS domain S-box protein [Candidatus Bathyarchaeum sp.]